MTFDQLPGWHKDHQLQTLPAMLKSCDVILKKSPGTEMVTGGNGQGEARDWFGFCRKLKAKTFKSSAQLRHFVESELHPYRLSAGGDSNGVFTGYYEPILNGSLRRHGKYQTPLYKVPGKGINYKIPRSRIVKGAL